MGVEHPVRALSRTLFSNAFVLPAARKMVALESDGFTQTEVAAALGARNSNVVIPVFERLADAGYIKRSDDSTRRGIVFELVDGPFWVWIRDLPDA